MNAMRQFLMAGAVLALATGVYAADWYVSAGMDYGADAVDAAHRTNDIQAAINKAAQNDVIWVEDGFVCDSGFTTDDYGSWRLVCGKAMTFRAQGGDWRTGPTIRGAKDASVPSGVGVGSIGGFRKTAVNAKMTIIGFNFENCSADSGSDGGGGIKGNGASSGIYNLTLRNCRISGCAAPRGAGASFVEAYDCLFNDNLTGAMGGGIYKGHAYGCRFENNVQEGGTGAACGGGAIYSGTANTCVFNGNSAYIGGATYSVASTNCTFIDNVSGKDGGGAYSGGAVNSTFVGNHCASRGGGIYGGDPISNCVFACNVAGSYGGGIAIFNTAEREIFDCTITNNIAATTGGGVSSSLLGPVLYNSFVADNVATNDGGGTYNMALVDCVVTGNVTVTSRGGGAYRGTARNCEFLGNTAGSRGGGICATIARDCSIIGNTALIAGGGICGHYGQVGDATVESLFVTNCVIAGNTLIGDTTSSSSYGGAGAYGATLVNCVVTNNRSGCWNGGGTHLCNTINTLIVGNTCAFEFTVNNRGGGGVCGGTHYNALIAGNTSWGGGGGALRATLVNCTVVANTNASTLATLAGGCGDCNVVNTVSWGNVGGNDDGLRNHVATNSISAVSLAAYGPGNSTDDPLLRADSRGPYVPAVNSPCRNNGLVQEWMSDRDDVRSRALGGRARIVGSAPDIGAYEAGLDGTRLSVR